MTERSAWIRPEKTFVTGKIAEKRIAFPIGRALGYTPSTIIGAATHIHFVANISLTHKAVHAYTPPVKKEYLIKQAELSVFN